MLQQPTRSPWLTLCACLALLVLAAPGIGRLDDNDTIAQSAASALERDVAARYGLRMAVVVTATPDGPLLAPSTLQAIAELVDGLRAIPGVSAVQSLLDAPLVRNVDGRLAALADNYRTLRRDDVDLERAWAELTSSPLYRDTLVSADGRQTTIEVVLTPAGPRPSLGARLADAIAARCPPCLSWLPGTSDWQAQAAAATARPTTLDAIVTLLAQQPPILHTRLSGATVDGQARASALVDDLLRGTLLSVALIVLVAAYWLRDTRSLFVVMATTLASVLFGASLAGWSGLTLSNLAVASVPLALAENALLHGRVLRAAIGTATGASAAPCSVRLPGVSRLGCAGLALVMTPFEAVANFGALLLLAAFSMLTFSLTLLPSLAVLLRPAPRRLPPAAIGAAPRGRMLLTAASLIGVAGILLLKPGPEIGAAPVITSNAGHAHTSHANGELELHVLLAFPPATPPAATGTEDGELLAAIERDNSLADNWFTPTIVDRIAAVHAAMEALPGQVYVRSLASTLRVATQLNGGVDFNAFDLNLIHRRLPRAVRAAVVEPYVAMADNEARVVVRLAPGQVSPDALLARVRTMLDHDLGLQPTEYRLAGTLVSAVDHRARLVPSLAWVGVAVLVLQTTVLLALQGYRRSGARASIFTLLWTLAPGVAGVVLAFGLAGWAGLAVTSMTVAAGASALALTLHAGEEQATAACTVPLSGLACLTLLGTPIATLADFCVIVAVAVTAAGVFRLTFLPAALRPHQAPHAASGQAY